MVDDLAQKIWDYLQLHQPLKKADLIFVLCSHDLRVANYAADLFLQGYAPFVLFSGGQAHKDDLLRTGWKKTEAEVFADVALKKGIPRDKVLIENQAQNTGENIQFGYKLLRERGILVEKMILVQKPYMERRAYATFMKQWPGLTVELIVTSPQISFADYPNAEISKDSIINIMVGDLQRIKVYAEKGFQIPQEIPEDVWKAYTQLVELGYTKHLIQNE